MFKNFLIKAARSFVGRAAGFGGHRRPPAVSEKWKEVCISQDTFHCRKMAEYSVVSAVLSDAIYKCDNADGNYQSPLTRQEFARKLQTLQQQHSWFRPVRFSQSIVTNSDDETVFALVDFGEYHVLVIRGSVTPADWECNYATNSYNWNTLSGLHQGFCHRAQSVPAEFISHLGNNKPTIFCGHSMGGAVAAICALPLIANNRDVYAISFGAPSFSLSDPLINDPDLQKRLLRFALCNDIVPMITKLANYNVFERLVTMSCQEDGSYDVGYDPNNLTGRIFLVNSLAQFFTNRVEISQKHAMASYVKAMLGLCHFMKSDDAEEARPVLTLEALQAEEYIQSIAIDKKSLNVVCHRAGDNNEVILEINGQGSNAAIVAAATYDSDTRGEIKKNTINVSESVSYHCYNNHICQRQLNERKNSCECEFTFRTNVTNRVAAGASILSDSNDTFLHLSNGFETIKLECHFVSDNNVAVVGNISHGKSHLVRALQLHSEGMGCVPEEFNDGVLRAEDSKARRFRYEDMVIYETPGLVTTSTSNYMETMARVFAKHPPKLILLTFKANDKTDKNALPNFIERLKQVNANRTLPKMFLVVTNCHIFDIDDKGRKFARQVIETIGCGDISVYFVNSAQACMTGGVKFEPQGIPKLWEAIMAELRSADGVPNPIKLNTWNECHVLYTLGSSSLTAALLGWWLIGTQHLPPFLL